MLKLPLDPGPNADFYDTIRYLQRGTSYIIEHLTAIEFNQKAHAAMTDTFGNVLADSTAATREMVAASTAERAQLADITAQLTVTADKLAQALADLAAAGGGAPPAPFAEMQAHAKSQRDEVSLLTADDTAVIPPVDTTPVEPAPADGGNVPSA
jgi:hypothetical protein